MKAKQLAKVVNKRTLKLLSLIGALLAAAAAVVSALGALLVVKQLRLAEEQRKALPVLRRAAELYIEQNEPEAEKPSRRPRPRRDPVPADPASAPEKP